MSQVRLFHLIFVLIVVGDLVGRVLQSVWLDYIFKPLILLCLGVFFYLENPEKDRLNKTILWAIFFAWAGDVFLMFTDKGELFFPLGLVCFLVSHIFYILAYRLSFPQNAYSLLETNKRLVLPFIFVGASVYTFLFNKLGVLQIPVFFYTFVLVGMSVFALNRYKKVSQKSFLMVFVGSLFFLISDMCLAINMFAFPIPASGIVVMTTYITAQYLIIRGIRA